MDEFDLDDVTPASEMIQREAAGVADFAQGSYVTRVQYETMEYQPFEDWAESAGAKLQRIQDAVDKGKLVVIRSADAGKVIAAARNAVYTYSGCRIDTISQEAFVDELAVTKKMTLYPNIRHQLVCYAVDSDGNKDITVQLNDFSFWFNDRAIGIENEKLYLPPVWLRVKMSSSNRRLGQMLAIVPEPDRDPRKSVLKFLCFPNLYRSGRICMGSTRLTSDAGQDPSEEDTVNLVVSQIFGSEWNLDLLTQPCGVLGPDDQAYEALGATAPDTKRSYDARLQGHSRAAAVQQLIKLVAVLTVPGGWMGCRFPDLDCTADKFMTGGI